MKNKYDLTAEDLRPKSQTRVISLLSYAKYCVDKYKSVWCSINFVPTQDEIKELHSRGFRVFKKETLEEDGVSARAIRGYEYSLNWQDPEEGPTDDRLIEVK